MPPASAERRPVRAPEAEELGGSFGGSGRVTPGLLALAASVSLLTPSPAWAAVFLAAPEGAPAGEVEASEASEAEVEAESESESEGETSEAESEPELQPEVTEVEEAEVPTGGGVAGAVVDPDDPNATRAQSDLEGESLDEDVAGVPERLPKLQVAGWWTTFTAVALATTGGIFAGVAEVRQDEAERLAYSFDLETGRTTLYGDVAEDYEQLLREGQNYQWVARGFVIAGGVMLIAGITTFAIDGARRRKAERSGVEGSSDPAPTGARLRLEPGPGGLRLRF